VLLAQRLHPERLRLTRKPPTLAVPRLSYTIDRDAGEREGGLSTLGYLSCRCSRIVVELLAVHLLRPLPPSKGLRCSRCVYPRERFLLSSPNFCVAPTGSSSSPRSRSPPRKSFPAHRVPLVDHRFLRRSRSHNITIAPSIPGRITSHGICVAAILQWPPRNRRLCLA
jgi:hypothetical protein